MPPGETRGAAAEAILRSHGVDGARVRVAGPDAEVALVQVEPRHALSLLDEAGSRIVAEIQALGFRYVALDLEGDDPGS